MVARLLTGCGADETDNVGLSKGKDAKANIIAWKSTSSVAAEHIDLYDQADHE
jgi:hypothetical protein